MLFYQRRVQDTRKWLKYVLKVYGQWVVDCGGDALGSEMLLEVVTDRFRLRLRFNLID